MPYTLKESDGTHTVIGTSNGNQVPDANNTFWVTGWSPATQQAVQVGGFYTLVFTDGHSNAVEVEQLGGPGMGGIRFALTG